MPKEKKTNAARILDREGVTYRLVPYEVDPDNLAADHVAESLGDLSNACSRRLCSAVTAQVSSYA